MLIPFMINKNYYKIDEVEELKDTYTINLVIEKATQLGNYCEEELNGNDTELSLVFILDKDEFGEPFYSLTDPLISILQNYLLIKRQSDFERNC